MSLTVSLAEFIAGTRYEDLPEKAILAAKSSFLDTMGAAVAGSAEEASRIVTRYVRRWGGDPAASVVGSGFKTSTRNAALANGMAADVLGLSDTTDVYNHPSATVLPAIWALAEVAGASGKEVLLAHVLGVEVSTKIGMALHPASIMKGWQPVSVYGAFGATAAAGRILGLDVRQMANALGLAGVEASGVRVSQGTMGKSYGRGRAAENGVVAAELASGGLTGPTNVLEGPGGFLQTFGDGAGGEGILPSLGNPYQFVSPGMTLKPYPCCTHAHASLDGILKLRRDHQLSPDQIESVEFQVSPAVAENLRFVSPRVPSEAKYSLHFCCAAALADGEVTLDSFSPGKLVDPSITGLMKRIQMTVSPERAKLGYGAPGVGLGATVVVRLKGGEVYSHDQDRPTWAPETPPSMEALLSKYRVCAGRVLSPKEVEESIEIMTHLEDARDVRRLMDVVRV